jgi:hypothetical protein
MLSQKKKEIHFLCLRLIEEKIAEVKKQISELNQSFADESKSSAGDKHETARAMAQLESEKLHQHLHQLTEQSAVLLKIDLAQEHDQIHLGTLIKTNNNYIFIAIPLGKLTMDEEVLVISSSAPIFAELKNKKVGDEFKMGNRNLKIEWIG